MATEVSDAAISALNARLQAASVSNFNDVIRETTTFMEPLIMALQLSPLQPASSPKDSLPPAEMMVIEAAQLMPPLVL